MNDIAETFTSSLDELIASMPEEPEAASAPPAPPKRDIWLPGWDARWRQDESEPRGEKWWEAHGKALKVVNSGGIVVLHGTRGSGKTKMAYHLSLSTDFPLDRKGEFAAGMVMPRRHTARYTTAMGFFLDVRATFGKKSKRSEREVVDEMTDPGLLILDEIQERSESAWENRLLTHIIDSRYGSLRPTIIIANLTAAEMKDSLGPSIMDRIYETGGAIEFTWESYRRVAR